jgi:hypothetical protein
VLVLVVLAAAYAIPRFLLAPERRPWQIWLPAVVAIVAVVWGIASRDWAFASIFAIVLLIEIWRTLPTWRTLRAASKHDPPPVR